MRGALILLATLATLTIGTLPAAATTAGLSSAGTVAAVSVRVVSVRVVAGDTSWDLSARHCGTGNLYRSMTVESPSGVFRALHLIYPGDRATIPCARYGQAADKPASKVTTTPPAWPHPLPGARCASPYGWRPAIYHDGKLISRAKVHRGVDLSRPSGTTIRAARAGTVTRAGWWRQGYGISVAIQHSPSSWTFYGHSSASLVRVGQRVTAGQAIARVGSTGASTGPHLHFEMWSGWKVAFNPTRVYGTRLGCSR